MKNININSIRLDGGTQSRCAVSDDTVADYADVIREGGKLPPVVVFHDGADHWLADGFHRVGAYRLAGKASIPADVRDGTRRDALLFAAGANAEHGLRRTNADKRRAVQMLLDDEEASQWSDREIARHCGVTHPLVAAVRTPKVESVTTAATPKPAPNVESVTTRQPAATPAEVETLSTPDAPITAADAYSDFDAAAELEKAEQVIRALEADDLKAELAKHVRLAQGLEARLSQEMQRNKEQERQLVAYGKWYAELRKASGLEERAAITRLCKEARNAKESAL
jgi:ParB-like chromosome segregation protein Spo0J